MIAIRAFPVQLSEIALAAAVFRIVEHRRVFDERKPCRLPVGVRLPVYARDQLRGELPPLLLGEGAGPFEKLLGRVRHRRDSLARARS